MFAAIDLGSNTLRLLLGRVEEGIVRPVDYQRRICRLAENLTAGSFLSAEAMERTFSALAEFAGYCRLHRPQKVCAVGTAAFRNAANGRAFAERLSLSTGIPLKIISGNTEARLTAAGVLSVLAPTPEMSLIVDIGGGSTELILCINGIAVWQDSVALGVVRLTEAYPEAVQRQSEIQIEVDRIKLAIDDACRTHGCSQKDIALVGTAGTFTTLAALDMKMDNYSWQRVNNYTMSASGLESWYRRLIPLTPAEREQLPGMEAGRGDLIIAGLEIVLSLLDQLKILQLKVSDFGILEGLILSLHHDREIAPFH